MGRALSQNDDDAWRKWRENKGNRDMMMKWKELRRRLKHNSRCRDGSKNNTKGKMKLRWRKRGWTESRGKDREQEKCTCESKQRWQEDSSKRDQLRSPRKEANKESHECKKERIAGSKKSSIDQQQKEERNQPKKHENREGRQEELDSQRLKEHDTQTMRIRLEFELFCQGKEEKDPVSTLVWFICGSIPKITHWFLRVVSPFLSRSFFPASLFPPFIFEERKKTRKVCSWRQTKSRGNLSSFATHDFLPFYFSCHFCLHLSFDVSSSDSIENKRREEDIMYTKGHKKNPLSRQR